MRCRRDLGVIMAEKKTPPDLDVDPAGWLSYRFELERERLLLDKSPKRRRGWWVICERVEQALIEETRPKRAKIPGATPREAAAAAMRERRRAAKGKPCPRCGEFCQSAPHFRVGFEPGRRRLAPKCSPR